MAERIDIDSFTTARLCAERLRLDHLSTFHTIYTDPRVAVTLGGVRTAPQTEAILRENLQHWEVHGFGVWVFRDGQSGQFVGRCGLRRVSIEGVDEVEVAYVVAADLWGRGFATEMARAAVRIGFERIALQEIVAIVLPHNLASRRVMERLDFSYERDIVHFDLPHMLHRLTCAAWRRRLSRQDRPSPGTSSSAPTAGP